MGQKAKQNENKLMARKASPPFKFFDVISKATEGSAGFQGAPHESESLREKTLFKDKIKKIA